MRVPGAPDPCIDDEAAKHNSEEDRRGKKNCTNSFWSVSLQIWKGKLEGISFHQSEQQNVWVSHIFSPFFFRAWKVQKIDFCVCHTKMGQGEDCAIPVLCVTKHTAMDRCIRILDTLSPHHTTDAATVDLPYVYVCVSLHAENKPPAFFPLSFLLS